MVLISNSPRETMSIGKRIAKKLRKGDILCLFGEFGSGKTILTKGIALGLSLKKEEIISPSFVLLRQYSKAKIPLYHFDLYRLKKMQEIISLGYEEYFYNQGITVVEWAGRLKSLLPKEYLSINLEIIGPKKRKIEIIPLGSHYEDISY